MNFDSTNDMSNQINDLIKMAGEKIACGPDCEKQKKTSELYQDYLNSQTNYLTAPEQVKTAAKKYYVETRGTAAYNDFNKNQLTITADLISEKLSEKFNQQISDAHSFNKLYNTDLINAENTQELYKYYLDKNKTLISDVTKASSDIYTNDRRSYYESQELENLEWWYTIEIWIYALVVLTFIVFSIFGTPIRSRKVLLIAIVIMICYPFVSTTIALYILSCVKWLFSFFPKNVYL